MRHIIVTRVTALLSGLFVAAAMLFAWLTTRADVASPAAATPQPERAMLFEIHCASCHTADTLRPALRDLTVGRRRELEAFLGRHGEAAPEDDREILEYLAGKNPRPPD